MPVSQGQPFRFSKHSTVGAEGAEEDGDFLSECFVDTGDLSILRNTSVAQRIVLGRTGAGKTALLLRLREVEGHVAWIEPDELALSYLSNSTVLQHLESMGVKLDIFYRLLWRHIFAVELIKLKYQLRSNRDQKSFLANITARFLGDKRKAAALDYLVEWGEHFWEDTEYRIHEVTKRLIEDVKAELGSKAALFDSRFGGAKQLSSEDRKEIVHRVQQVVNSVQIQKLAKILEVLGEDVFDDPQESFFVVIDRLDEGWIDDILRYRLIRALIETVRDFQKVRTAKVVVAIREDLLERVFRETRDSGFQEEKYQPLLLPLHWSERELMEVLDTRLKRLVRQMYTSQSLSSKDLLPAKIGKIRLQNYLCQRTMYRPRDVIQFMNCCLSLAVERKRITAHNVKEAEARYSDLRYRSLGDEWAADYPDLLSFAAVLKRRPTSFPATEITHQDLERVCVDAIDQKPIGIAAVARRVFENKMNLDEFLRRLIKIFYKVGLVGIRAGKSTGTSWSFKQREKLREAEITERVRLEVCPMFFRVLGTVVR